MIKNNPQPSWYALHTLPHKEKSVSIELDIRNIEWYLPYYKKLICKTKYKEKLLLSTYIFVQSNKTDLDALNFIPGSKGLLKINDEAGVVSDKEIQLLRQICDEADVELENKDLVIGKKIMILNSTFQGKTAYICKNKKNKVALSLLNSNLIIWINIDKLLYQELD